MNSPGPPRLATALLRRFLPGNEPLAGDLLERFEASRSRLWFWREVIAAIVIQALQRPDRDHPLGVGEHPEWVLGERSRNADPPRRVNLTASPLPGVGGLSLVALGGIVTVVEPQAWWMFVPAVAGGAALGVTMALVRRRAALGGSAREDRTLFASVGR